MIDLDKLEWENETPPKPGFYFTRNKAVPTLAQVVEIYEASDGQLRIRGTGKNIKNFKMTWEFSKSLETLIAP